MSSRIFTWKGEKQESGLLLMNEQKTLMKECRIGASSSYYGCIKVNWLAGPKHNSFAKCKKKTQQQQTNKKQKQNKNKQTKIHNPFGEKNNTKNIHDVIGIAQGALQENIRLTWFAREAVLTMDISVLTLNGRSSTDVN